MVYQIWLLYFFFLQCQGLLHDCLSAADGLIQKGQCMLQFGLCMAAQVVECGKDVSC